jgi:T-lymphocyte triggering factor
MSKNTKPNASPKGIKGSKGKSTNEIPKESTADPLESMNLQQLQAEAEKLQTELTEAAYLRNYTQQHYTFLKTLTTNANDEIIKTESHIKNLSSQVERIQECHSYDIQQLQRKITYLAYEHQNSLQHVANERTNDLKDNEEQHEKTVNDLYAARQHLREEYEKETEKWVAEIHKMRENERKEMSKLKETFDRTQHEMKVFYEDKIKQIESEMGERMLMEISEIEERKNSHYEALHVSAEESYKELKDYYTHITNDNVALIKDLQAEIEILRENRKNKEEEQKTLEHKNEEFSLPLLELRTNVSKLQVDLHNFDKERTTLIRLKARTKKKKTELATLQQENEVVEMEINEKCKEKEMILKTRICI